MRESVVILGVVLVLFGLVILTGVHGNSPLNEARPST